MSNIVYGELEPGAASRGTSVWLRLQNGSSIPMGMYWYVIEAKVWLPIPPASRCLGDVELFIGNPEGIFDMDETKSPASWGKALVDGPKVGWALMNGLNGTTLAQDCFICSPALGKAVDAFHLGSKTWHSKIEASILKSRGGEASVALEGKHVPSLSHQLIDPGHSHIVMQPEDRPDRPRSKKRPYGYRSSPQGPVVAPFDKSDPEEKLTGIWGGTRPSMYTLTSSKAGITISSTPSGWAVVAHNNVPPFLVICPIQWIGYDSYKRE